MYQYGGWSNVRMQPQQSQPHNLPPGWEAKWDPGNRRWFFVDHTTKTTHWQLPSAQAQPSPRVTTTSFINADLQKAKLLQSEYEGVNEDYIKDLLKTYQNNMTSVRRTLDSKGYKKKPLVQPKAHFVTSLKKQFPSADVEIIKQVLVNTNNNFVGSRMAIEAMGYERKIEESVISAPKKTTAKPKPAKAVAATKSISTSVDLTEAAKKERLAQLKKKFPTVAESVIELSLVGTMYDVNMASEILRSSLESVNTKSSTTIPSTSFAGSAKSRTPTKTQSRTTTTVKSPERKPANLTPVIFGADDSKDDYKTNIPSVSSTIDATPQSSYTKPAAGEYKKREYKPPARKMYPRKTQAPAPSYQSKNRSKPMGPNPSLVNGPDSSLLQTELIKAMGPDMSIRRGPQRSNRRGPVPSNAKGRAGIATSPMHSRV